jgi:hypothetical protein
MSRGKKYTHASFAIRATFSTIDHNCPTTSLACPRCNHHKAAALELFATMDNWPTSQPWNFRGHSKTVEAAHQVENRLGSELDVVYPPGPWMG